MQILFASHNEKIKLILLWITDYSYSNIISINEPMADVKYSIYNSRLKDSYFYIVNWLKDSYFYIVN